MAKQEVITRNGQTVGVGETISTTPMVATPSIWTEAIITSVVGAAAGWAIEEVVMRVRGRGRRR